MGRRNIDNDNPEQSYSKIFLTIVFKTFSTRNFKTERKRKRERERKRNKKKRENQKIYDKDPPPQKKKLVD